MYTLCIYVCKKMQKLLLTHFTHILVIIEQETQIIRNRFCETGMDSLFFVKGQVYSLTTDYFHLSACVMSYKDHSSVAKNKQIRSKVHSFFFHFLLVFFLFFVCLFLFVCCYLDVVKMITFSQDDQNRDLSCTFYQGLSIQEICIEGHWFYYLHLTCIFERNY